MITARFEPDCVFSHVNRPIDAVELDVEAAGVTDESSGLVPPPHRRLRRRAVGADRAGIRTSELR